MAAASAGLVAFINQLEGHQLEALFTQPYATVALLRSLQPLARQVLARLVCTGGAISAALVSSFARPEASSKLAAALGELTSLRLLSKAAQGGQQMYVLHPSFQAQLRQAMCCGMMDDLQAAALPPPDAAPPSAAELAAFARQQWEAVLLFLVDGASSPPSPPHVLRAAPLDVPSLLAAAGLMLKNEYTQRQSISEAGFQFLLTGLYSQLWAVVRQYLAGLGAGPTGGQGGPPGGGSGLAVAINFLLRLGLQAGRPICYSQLGPAERAIAAHMAQLGLLMPAAAGADVWLHPTRLAAVLAGGGRAGESAAASEDGYVIVESNFRVYAYTTSAVQVAVLRIFVRCDALLPNLVVGTVTRDSASAALALGITATQMADFLRQHAHPRAAAKHPVVPAVVTDQLRLWQAERARLRAQPAAIYSRFESPQLFSGAVEFARQAGALLYCSQERQQLAVDASFHDAMRGHLRERKMALGL
ncbi:hypothetical protein ABPG75_013055 [Micractinium tetrahymenae]